MNCCQCQGLDSFFNKKTAAQDLKDYHKKGPQKTTRMLIEAIAQSGIRAETLLDVGGGIGAIQHELLKRGLIRQAVGVDASQAYLHTAQAEAQRQGHAERISYHHANFVELAPSLEPAGIVTLDRSICCYHDMPGLVGQSVSRATQLYGVVFPKDSWWIKLGMVGVNLMARLMKESPRFFAHPTTEIEAIIRQQGFERCFYQTTFLWQVILYRR